MNSNGKHTGNSGGERYTARLRDWILLDGHRGAVIGGIVGVLFLLVTAVSSSGASPFENTQPLFYVFSGLISGNLTIITVVVSINQLLLSRELRTPSELRSQMEGTIEYRNQVEDAAGQPAPVEPMGFLRILFENARQTAQKLGGVTLTEASDDVTEAIEQVVSNVTENADRVDGLLQDSDASTFTVLSTTLGTNYARDIHRLRRIKLQWGDQLPSDVGESIDRLVDQLQDIDVARQYFKGVYLQQELASLSRILFYVGLPAVTVVVLTLLVLTAGNGATVPDRYLPVLVSVAITAGLLPLVTLFVFIIRTATVARRTAALVPFTAPSQEK